MGDNKHGEDDKWTCSYLQWHQMQLCANPVREERGESHKNGARQCKSCSFFANSRKLHASYMWTATIDAQN